MGSVDSKLWIGLFALLLIANLALASDAIVAYRSNTGSAPANQIPKIRFWDSTGSGSWGPEIELPAAGDDISYVIPRYSPVSDKIIVIVQDTAGNLNGYVCMSNCNQTSSWILTQDIATVSFMESSERLFDLEFETTSGDAVLVYEVFSSLNTKDLGYQVLPAAGTNFSGLAENYIDDTGHYGAIEYQWVSMAADPTSDELIVTAFDDTYNQINAWVWDGSSWGNYKEISSSASNTANDEALAVEYAADGSKGMVIAAKCSSGFVHYSYWDGSSWSSVGIFDLDPSDSGDLRWATLKADPSSDDLQATLLDSRKDLNTAYWDGSSWSITSNIDTSVDSVSTRVADFAWLPTGSTGILVWDSDGNGDDLKQTLCAPECNGSISSVSSYSGAGDFMKLLTNPDVGDLTDVLAIRLHTAPDAPDIGSFAYNGTGYLNYGDSVITDKARSGFEIGAVSVKQSEGNVTPSGNCPVITTSGTYTQTQNFAGAPNFVYTNYYACVAINADDVTFDCDGYDITGNGTLGSYQYGVYVNASNVTIENCPGISNYSSGVRIESGPVELLNSTIFNVVTAIGANYPSTASDYDLYLNNVTMHDTTSNAINTNNGDTFTAEHLLAYDVLGLNLNLPNNVIIDDLVIHDFLSTGLLANTLNHTEITNSFIHDAIVSSNGADISSEKTITAINNTFYNLQGAFHIDSNGQGGEKVIIQNTNISNVSNQANYIYQFNALEITNMAVEGVGNAYVAYIQYVNNTNITNLNASDCDSAGISYRDAENFTVSNANFSNVSENNIYVIDAENIVIDNLLSQYVSGGGTGIQIYDANNTQISNVIINTTASNAAIYLSGINGLNITNAEAYNVPHNTIEIYTSNYVNITNAIVHNVTGQGNTAIDISGSTNVMVQNSVVSKNYHGIEIESCDDVLLENNTASYAEYRDFQIQQSDNVALIDNTAFGGGTDPGQTEAAGIGVINANISGSNNRLYNNSHDLFLWGGSLTGYSSLVNLSATIFDRPTDSLQNFTNLTIDDYLPQGEKYWINWTTNSSALPGTNTSFRGKWVEIENVSSGPTIDSLVWHWTDAELPGYDETTFAILEYDGSWSDAGATLSRRTKLSHRSMYCDRQFGKLYPDCKPCRSTSCRIPCNRLCLCPDQCTQRNI